MKQRLDKELSDRGLVSTRSQAESFIKMGEVSVNGKVVLKPGFMVNVDAKLEVSRSDQYVSRAAYKLQSVADKLGIDFNGKTVLDVGSSTGGFTDFALKHGAIKVIAVDVGTDQLHESLRSDPRIELHEKTDIRSLKGPLKDVDIAVIDVSFISIKEILPSVSSLIFKKDAVVVAMVKPQFEVGSKTKNKGVIKNDTLRRKILKEFESWSKKYFVTVGKADSEIAGSKGNRERFYLLTKTRR